MTGTASPSVSTPFRILSAREVSIDAVTGAINVPTTVCCPGESVTLLWTSALRYKSALDGHRRQDGNEECLSLIIDIPILFRRFPDPCACASSWSTLVQIPLKMLGMGLSKVPVRLCETLFSSASGGASGGELLPDDLLLFEDILKKFGVDIELGK